MKFGENERYDWKRQAIRSNVRKGISFAHFNVRGAVKQPLAAGEQPGTVGEDWPSVVAKVRTCHIVARRIFPRRRSIVKKQFACCQANYHS